IPLTNPPHFCKLYQAHYSVNHFIKTISSENGNQQLSHLFKHAKAPRALTPVEIVAALPLGFSIVNR
ncbi:MAG: hypothetical protein RR379_10505, partial [Clostridia bacterium]